MVKIKAIIADDEEQLRIYLRKGLLDLWPDLYICGEAGNGKDALALFEEHHPHIAFLDIRMPGPSGLDVAKDIAGSCWIVFITAYDQYAVKAFENEAIDYLLKPVTKERLEKTIRRLKNHIAVSYRPPADFSEIVDKLANALAQKDKPVYIQWIRIQHGNSIRLTAVDDVYYFKASEKYTTVITKEGELLIRKPIKELENELDPKKFWRIHRGTIVNVNCILNVKRSFSGRGLVSLKDRPEFLTVSRPYMRQFKQM